MPARERKFGSAAGFVCTGLVCLCLGFFAPTGPAQVATQNFSAPLAPVASQFAIADFDGDDRPDLATVQTDHAGTSNALYRVAVRFGSGTHRSIAIVAPSGGLRVVSRDVNGDSFLDIVVTTLWENQPVTVLLNDGRGNFTPSAPSSFPAAFVPDVHSRLTASSEIPYAAPTLVTRQLSAEGNSTDKHASLPVDSSPIGSSLLNIRCSASPAPFSGRAPPTFEFSA